MTDPVLRIYLIAAMLIVILLFVFWKKSRIITKFTEPSVGKENITEYKEYLNISLFNWIIFSVFGIMTFIYSLFPEFYYIFLPLDIFHYPLINSIGLFILKIAVIWIVVAQFHIDKEIYKYSRNIEARPAMDMLKYFERKFLFGMLVLFLGIFTTITNILGFLLVVLSLITYFKIFLSKRSHQFEK